MTKISMLSIFGLTLITMASCQRNCSKEKVLASWTENKVITLNISSDSLIWNYNVADGDQLVFSLNHADKECSNIADDEFGEIITFQVDPGAESFEFTDEELLAQNCFYHQYGAWVSGRRYPISKGKIYGEKRSDRKWNITIDVETIPFETESPISVVFDEKFVLE